MSDESEEKDTTAPPGGKTHEATTPPGSGERDEDAIKKGDPDDNGAVSEPDRMVKVRIASDGK